MLDFIFTGAFTIEMICKLIGLGFASYLIDGFNIFDAIIVFISIVDVTLYLSLEDNESIAMRAFRGMRLLRVIKLARIWKAF